MTFPEITEDDFFRARRAGWPKGLIVYVTIDAGASNARVPHVGVKLTPPKPVVRTLRPEPSVFFVGVPLGVNDLLADDWELVDGDTKETP